MQFLDKKQITDIMRVAYKRSTRDHLILLLSYHHGLRVSEVTRLTLVDVADGKDSGGLHAWNFLNAPLALTAVKLAKLLRLLGDESMPVASWARLFGRMSRRLRHRCALRRDIFILNHGA